MNELFKGLIGAELTLLGVPNPAMPVGMTAEPARALPRALAREAAHSVQEDDSAPDAAKVKFDESHYRIAAG
ncbi:hypothetical protein [Bordetella genomosp. 9]|uniref:Uncharacterized protein n=1 Tax=Bordetella genomosp. 9 TaxID=1416803 RepID=A0A1W6YWV0_9BORD|nr:hypothetical protein [Bordetella genomosp. 9]ARP85508.1 hypothetical protein CAL13_04230 [Bordetella genomosp. 9]